MQMASLAPTVFATVTATEGASPPSGMFGHRRAVLGVLHCHQLRLRQGGDQRVLAFVDEYHVAALQQQLRRKVRRRAAFKTTKPEER